jgi:hypothetical protein
MTSSVRRLVLPLLLVAWHADGIAAQAPPPPIVPGWDLDTTGANPGSLEGTAVREGWSLWRDYLAARMKGVVRADLWLHSELSRWPEFDLTAFQAHQSFSRTAVTVLSIRPPAPNIQDTLVIRTLFARTTIDSVTRTAAVRPVALTRVYAVRTPLGWRLSNALTSVTSGWSRAQEGAITFLYSPSVQPDVVRRRAAARFVDSLAVAHRVAIPRNTLYVVAATGEEAYRAVGLDYAVIGSVTAGKTYVSNNLILAGDSRLGEAYLHELAHLVFAPIAPPDSIPLLINEGLAIWAGGTLGQSYSAARRDYARVLQQRSEITLDMVVDGSVRGDMRAGGAVLCQMVFEVGGAAAIRVLLTQLRQTDIRRAVEMATGQPWSTFAARWRAQASTAPSER